MRFSFSRRFLLHCATLLTATVVLSELSVSTARAQQFPFSFINIDPSISVYGFNDLQQVYGLDAGGNVVRSGPNAQGFVTLGSLDPNSPNNTPFAINNSGMVAGYGTTPDFTNRAFVSSGNNLALIPTLGDQADPMNLQGLAPFNNNAYAINNHGQIVGNSETLYNDGAGNFFQTKHGFLYDNGVLTDLGVIPDLSGNTDFSRLTSANSINDAGDIVGDGDTQAANGAFEDHAFVYHNGQYFTLGTLNDTISSLATGINNQGQIIGNSTFQPGNFNMHAFLHTGNGLLMADDDIGTFGGDSSSAYYINDLGQVVGLADDANGMSLPFLYQNHTLYRINDLLPADAGLTVQFVYGLNNNGQILGSGLDASGQSRYFLLTVPEPGSVAAMGIGCWVLGVGVLRRRRR